MTNKQQIDVMLDDMTNILVDECKQEMERNRYGGHTRINMRVLAQSLFIQNYRKIDENAVILTKEEFWKLSNKFSKKELDEIVDFHKNKTRKETAKEILTKWFNSDLCETGGYCVPYIRELAKQYGVEV